MKTKALNQAVQRNIDRFPEDFMFSLTEAEKKEVVTICDHLPALKFSPNLPRAFTEYGAVMAASILNSSTAVQVSVFVVRAFINMRRMISENRALAERMLTMERTLEDHGGAIRLLAKTLRELTEPPVPKKRRKIGF